MDLENPKYWKLLINQSLLRFFLLRSLENKEIHGYALQSALTVISNGLCKPSQGTIYPALNDLESEGYVKGKWKRVENRNRKLYTLTAKGRVALGVATEVLAKALQAASKGQESEFEEKTLALPFDSR